MPAIARREMKRYTLDLPVKGFIKAIGDDDDGTIEGLGSAYGNQDSYGDIVVKGAFAEACAAVKSGQPLPMLWQHDWRNPIGTWTDLNETDAGLMAKGKLVMSVQQAQEAHALCKAQAVTGLSIGFCIPKGGAVELEGAPRQLIKLDLMEISPVTFPANDQARITDVREDGREIIKRADVVACNTVREFEELLRDAGFSIRAAQLAASRWQPESKPGGTPGGSQLDDPEFMKALKGLADKFNV